jgi:hypothetical protein
MFPRLTEYQAALIRKRTQAGLATLSTTKHRRRPPEGATRRQAQLIVDDQNYSNRGSSTGTRRSAPKGSAGCHGESSWRSSDRNAQVQGASQQLLKTASSCSLSRKRNALFSRESRVQQAWISGGSTDPVVSRWPTWWVRILLGGGIAGAGARALIAGSLTERAKRTRRDVDPSCGTA